MEENHQILCLEDKFLVSVNSIIKAKILTSKHFPLSQQQIGRKHFYQIICFLNRN
jgi:hypothetical protein